MNDIITNPVTSPSLEVDDKLNTHHIEDEKHVDYADAARAEDFQHSISFKRSLVVYRVVCQVLVDIYDVEADVDLILGDMVVFYRINVHHNGRVRFICGGRSQSIRISQSEYITAWSP
jgi:hypothetical protein